MKKLLILPLAAAMVMMSGCCAPKCCAPTCCKMAVKPVHQEIDPVIGNWSAKLPYDDMSAASLIFSRDENGQPKAFVLLRWASPEWCVDVQVKGREFSFRHAQHKALIRGKVEGDKLFAEIAKCDKDGKQKGEWQKFEGYRNKPACPFASTKNIKLGEPIDLLRDGLKGWKTMNPKAKFGWSFKDGILSNKLGLKPDGKWAGGGCNLMSLRNDFKDFNLEYDVRVPKDSNSGVYLRGRFECQVVDSFGKGVDRHNMAAYYGRVTPICSAEKAPGEWQHVSVTLFKRRMTVVLNGVTIIEDAELTGVTGGAIDANIDAPGPIYLQGDHSDADFKNMILRPAL